MQTFFDASHKSRVCFILFLAIWARSEEYLCAQSQDANAFRGVAKVLANYASDPIVLMKPGMLIDPTFDQTEATSTAPYQAIFSQMETFSLLNKPSGVTLPDLYRQILTTAQWARVPLISGQREELATNSNKLYKADGSRSVGYQNYLSKKKIHDDVVARWESTPVSARTAELADQMQAAQEDLELLGHSNVYGPAESRYRLLSEEASLKWRDDDISLLARTSSTVGLKSDVDIDFDKLEKAPWIHVAVSGNQLNANASELSLGASMDPEAPWWTWTGTAPAEGNCIHFPSDPFTIQFDVALLHLTRDWFDPHVFQSSAWRFSPASKLISDGDEVHNMGASPLFPSGVLIMRNLVINGRGFGQCAAGVRAAVRAREGISFGPFALGGTNLQGASFYLPAIVTGSSVQVPYYQIIGLTTNMLPRMPNPNPDFLWP